MCRSASWMPLALVMARVTLALATDVPALPALHCPTDATEDQCSEHSSTKFSVNGFIVDFIYEVSNHLISMECNNDLQLDSEQTSRWLPRFTPSLHVGNVTVANCLPAHYATVLAALNVTTTSPFNLELSNVRQDEPLTAAHFTDLPPLHHLTLRDAGVLHGLPASMEGFAMEDTSLVNDTIPEALPRTLTELRLEGVNITRVPAALLDLPELRSLHVKTQTNVVVERSNTSRLLQLYVSGADAALMSDWAPPALEEVTLWIWQAVSPNPVPACDNLVKLTVVAPFVSDLPAAWVAHCSRLVELNINDMYNVKTLPARLLENATKLTNLRIIRTSLSSLPAQLFTYTPYLTHLNLYANKFKELPSSMLTLPLRSLQLGHNNFNASVVAELASLTELRSLSLVRNWKLGDLCAVNDSNVTEYKMKSSLASLSKLERLELFSTGISVICSDWREDMVNLKYLDLRYTKIRDLTYNDLQYRRSVPAVVKLGYGRIYFTADDYDRAAAAAAVALPSRNVTVVSSMKILDNCSLYWITEALNGDLLPLYDVQLDDSDGKLSLRTVRAEDLLCPSRETCVTMPSVCYCGMTGGGLLRIVCVGVKLDRVPQLPSLNNDSDIHAVDLVLSNNSITELVLDDLPPHLRVLELRNNSISYMTETTARTLVSGTMRRVLLAGNRLECSCRATPALRVLHDHAAVLVGHDTLRCEDGGTLAHAIAACSALVTTA